LQTHFKFLLLLVFYRNLLVNAHKVSRNLGQLVLEVRALLSFLKSNLQMAHCLIFVQNFLLANTQALVRKSLPLSILLVNRHVQNAFVKVGSCFPVVESFEHMGHFFVSLEALLAGALLTHIVFALNEALAQVCKAFLVLNELSLAALIELVLFDELIRRFDE